MDGWTVFILQRVYLKYSKNINYKYLFPECLYNFTLFFSSILSSLPPPLPSQSIPPSLLSHSLPVSPHFTLFAFWFLLSFALILSLSVRTSSQSALTRRSRKITSPLFRFNSALPLPRKSNIAWKKKKKRQTRVSEWEKRGPREADGLNVEWTMTGRTLQILWRCKVVCVRNWVQRQKKIDLK